MMAGRDISATKLAMGSTRVMGTCAVGGEAAGVAAARAAMLGMTPRNTDKSFGNGEWEIFESDSKGQWAGLWKRNFRRD